MERVVSVLVIASAITALVFGLYVYDIYVSSPSAPSVSGGAVSVSSCAHEGEHYSQVYTDRYPQQCCDGLTAWPSGMDTRIAIGPRCYDTGIVSGNPVGTCLNCGNGVCDPIENVCNCPLDCVGGQNSAYPSIDAFCSSKDPYAQSILKRCSENPKVSTLCSLCGY